MFEDLVPLKPCKNPKYLAWIRTRSCTICSDPNTVAHHCENLLPSRGLSIKHDLLAVPLCVKCHAGIHEHVCSGWDRAGIILEKAIIYLLIDYFGEKP